MWYAHISQFLGTLYKGHFISNLRAGSTSNHLPQPFSPSSVHFLGLHKYKHMENAKNVSKFGRACCMHSACRSAPKWCELKQNSRRSKTAIWKSVQAQLPLSLRHSWLESHRTNVGEEQTGQTTGSGNTQLQQKRTVIKNASEAHK